MPIASKLRSWMKQRPPENLGAAVERDSEISKGKKNMVDRSDWVELDVKVGPQQDMAVFAPRHPISKRAAEIERQKLSKEAAEAKADDTPQDRGR